MAETAAQIAARQAKEDQYFFAHPNDPGFKAHMQDNPTFRRQIEAQYFAAHPEDPGAKAHFTDNPNEPGAAQFLDSQKRVFPGAPDLPIYQQAPGNMQSTLNTQGLDKLRTQNLSNSFNPWTGMAMDNSRVQNMYSLDASRQGAGMQQPGGVSSLKAMREAAQRNTQNQNGLNSSLGQLRLNSQQDRVKNFQTQQQNDLSALQPQEFNINNSISQNQQQNAFNQNNYSQQMDAWASANQAKAQINAGKK